METPSDQGVCCYDQTAPDSARKLLLALDVDNLWTVISNRRCVHGHLDRRRQGLRCPCRRTRAVVEHVLVGHQKRRVIANFIVRTVIWPAVDTNLELPEEYLKAVTEVMMEMLPWEDLD